MPGSFKLTTAQRRRIKDIKRSAVSCHPMVVTSRDWCYSRTTSTWDRRHNEYPYYIDYGGRINVNYAMSYYYNAILQYHIAHKDWSAICGDIQSGSAVMAELEMIRMHNTPAMDHDSEMLLRIVSGETWHVGKVTVVKTDRIEYLKEPADDNTLHAYRQMIRGELHNKAVAVSEELKDSQLVTSGIVHLARESGFAPMQQTEEHHSFAPRLIPSGETLWQHMACAEDGTED